MPSKTQLVKEYLTNHPEWTNVRIAQEAGCSIRHVASVKAESQISPPGNPSAWCVNKDGEIPLTWYRGKPEPEEKVFKALEKRVPAGKTITPCEKRLNSDLMMEWKLFDHHMGMHSWAKETGNDYDLKISRELMIKCAEKAYSEFPDCHTSVIVLGGDTLHADNIYNETAKSKNTLDVDSRYDKAIDTAIESMTTVIDIAGANTKNVVIKVLSGNHDHHSAKWLARVLNAYYRTTKQITVDISPRYHKFFHWGKTFLAYVHGYVGSDQAHANFMLNYIIDAQLKPVPKYKKLRVAHLHKAEKKTPPGLIDINGVAIERFPTLAPSEAYAVEAGYMAERASTVTCFHKEYGQQVERDFKIGELV